MLLYYVKFLFTCKTKQLSCGFVRFIKNIIFLKDEQDLDIQYKVLHIICGEQRVMILQQRYLYRST